MDYQYPINLEGHDAWMESDYNLKLAHGDVITDQGEDIGTWRVVDYDPKDDDSGGRYEFIANGENIVKFSETFGSFDSRLSRGLALSNLTRAIKEWYEDQPM